MPLPVAQLGYMPNVHSPSARPAIPVRNPWQDLAMQVLGAVAQQGTQNLMSRDYATEAAQDTRAATPYTEQPVTGPENAPWYQKMLQGPQMGERQYAQEKATRATASEAEKARGFAGGEGKAERTSREKMHGDTLAQADKQFSSVPASMVASLGMSASTANEDRAVRREEDATRKSQFEQSNANDLVRLAQGQSGLDIHSLGNAQNAAVQVHAHMRKEWEDRNNRALMASMQAGLPPPKLPPAPTFQDALNAVISSGGGSRTFNNTMPSTPTQMSAGGQGPMGSPPPVQAPQASSTPPQSPQPYTASPQEYNTAVPGQSSAASYPFQGIIPVRQPDNNMMPSTVQTATPPSAPSYPYQGVIPSTPQPTAPSAFDPALLEAAQRIMAQSSSAPTPTSPGVITNRSGGKSTPDTAAAILQWLQSLPSSQGTYPDGRPIR